MNDLPKLKEIKFVDDEHKVYMQDCLTQFVNRRNFYRNNLVLYYSNSILTNSCDFVRMFVSDELNKSMQSTDENNE